MRYLLLIGLLVLLCVGYAQSLPKEYTFSNVGMTFLLVSADARSADLDDIFIGGNTGKVKEGITKTDLSAGFVIDPDNDFYFDETTGRIEMTDGDGQVIGYIETGEMTVREDGDGGNGGAPSSIFPATVRDTAGRYKGIQRDGAFVSFFGAMITELNKDCSFTEGERWIQRYMVEHPDEFKGRLVTFESRQEVGETVRRIDVTVATTENIIYYEFKSVANIPPKNFAQQFIKDLEIAENLDQIKWYFDGKKLSKLDKELFWRNWKRWRLIQHL